MSKISYEISHDNSLEILNMNIAYKISFETLFVEWCGRNLTQMSLQLRRRQVVGYTSVKYVIIVSDDSLSP